MHFHVLTLFPEMIEQGMNTSIMGRAIERGYISLKATDIRDYAANKHNKVDDTPYGGGAGMVMQAAPVYGAYEAVKEQIGYRPRVIYLTPQGSTFSQPMAEEFAKEQADITKLGENHVYFLPYLMGERSPHNNPKARGTFIGMTMDTTRADMTQAVLEGVAFALRDSFEVAKSLGIDIKRTKICGGGAKSPLWKKMIANILNISVDVIESEEGPGLGGAMLAAVACGEYASVEEAAGKIVKVIDTVEPDPVLAAKYEERYQQFKQIYPACKPLFDIIA